MRFVAGILAFTDADVWRPQIGDPTVMGWFTVAAYFGTAILCFRNFLASREGGSSQVEFWFWGTVALLLVALGINKQLDLQTFLTLTARRMAIAQGWYENRRWLQIAFVGFIIVTGTLALAIMWKLLKRTGSRLWIPFFGVTLLMGFVVIRAASFHNMDQLINLHLGAVRMNWILELGAIAVIAAGAWSARPGPVAHAAGGIRENKKAMIQ